MYKIYIFMQKKLIRILARALHEYVNFVHDPEKQYRSLSACWNAGVVAIALTLVDTPTHPVRDPLKSPEHYVPQIRPDLGNIILYWNSSSCARAARNLHATNLPVLVCVFSVNFQNSEFRISIPTLYVYFQSIFRNMLPHILMHVSEN